MFLPHGYETGCLLVSEATLRKHLDIVHGAYLSGIREAERIARMVLSAR